MEKNNEMNPGAWSAVRGFLANDLLKTKESLFALGPEYSPLPLAEERLDQESLSFIVGEHPSEYSVSPLMWNAEFKLRGAGGLFVPADIPPPRKEDLSAFLNAVFEKGEKGFRVITITNPYKIAALEYFRAQKKKNSVRVNIESDAEAIGATNQILVGPDNVFHVINSDGEGMANAIDAFSAECGISAPFSREFGLVGAGGAARGIAHAIAKRVSKEGGGLTVFNRTVEKAVLLARELSERFPGIMVASRPLDELRSSEKRDIFVSSITEGDPFLDSGAYEILSGDTLIIDANYGINHVLTKDAASKGRDDLKIYDGRGMVVEGYIIPSRLLAGLWGYRVPEEVYKKIGALFGYTPKGGAF